MKNLIALLAVLLLAVMGWFAWNRASSALPVEAAATARAAISEYVEERGKTRLPTHYQITVPFAGRVTEITLEVGDPVSQGQVVAQMVPEDLDLAVQEAQAAVDRLNASIRENDDASVEQTSKQGALNYVESMDTTVEAASNRVKSGLAKYEFAKRVYDRMKQLEARSVQTEEALERAELELISSDVDYRQDILFESIARSLQAATALLPKGIQQQIDRKILAHDVLLKEREQAEVRLQRAIRDRQRGEIVSPIQGVVLAKEITSEQHLAAGALLLEIGDLDQLEVEVDVLSQDAVAIAEGDLVEFFGPAIGPRPAHGKVKKVYPAGFTKLSSLGVEQQRVKVLLEIDPRELSYLRSERGIGVGYRVQLRIYTARKPDALVIPRAALLRSADGGWQLFVVRAGVARLQPVTTGLMNDQMVEILKGVEPGELVILAPESRLQDGQAVEPIVREADAAPTQPQSDG